MTTLALCRHGESEGNTQKRFGGHSATGLTALGRQQARAVGHALARAGVDSIYSSDLVRAMQTAEFIGKATGIVPETTAALRERSVGELTGLTFEEATDRYPEAVAALMRGEVDARPPGGETYRECQARAVAFLEVVLKQWAERRIVFVSHNITVQYLSRHLMGLHNASNSHPDLTIHNCGLHWFHRVRNSWTAMMLNERGHLTDFKKKVD